VTGRKGEGRMSAYHTISLSFRATVNGHMRDFREQFNWHFESNAVPWLSYSLTGAQRESNQLINQEKCMCLRALSTPDAVHKTLGYRLQTHSLNYILQHIEIIRSHQTQLPGKTARFLSTGRAIKLHICALVLRSSISLMLLNVCLPKRHKHQRQQNKEYALGPELALGKGANTPQVPKRAQLQPE
jgi:hypothetical protein